MHEFSICRTIVKAVLEEVSKIRQDKPVCLEKAQIAAGEYHRLVPESLKLAYEVLTKGTRAEGSKLKIRTVPLRLACKACGWKGRARDFLFACGRCQGTDVEIIAGKELFLESIDVKVVSPPVPTSWRVGTGGAEDAEMRKDRVFG